MYKNFDELFHLYCELVLENGKIILVEKNERINIMKSSRNEKNTEQQEISSIPANLSLNSLLGFLERFEISIFILKYLSLRVYLCGIL